MIRRKSGHMLRKMLKLLNIDNVDNVIGLKLAAYS